MTDETDPIGVSYLIISGLTDGTRQNERHGVISLPTSVKELRTNEEISRVFDLDFVDHHSDETDSLSQEDQKFLSILNGGIHKNVKYYKMPLPFREDRKLPINREAALKRLLGLKRRLQKEKEFGEGYKSFMQNLLDKGHAEIVPPEEIEGPEGLVWYLPHHGVYKKGSSKLRVVFDASAKVNNISLNDILLPGPVLTNNLIGVLLRFREEQVAIACDVEQMFYQFYVNPEHRDCLRFLWWDRNDCESSVVDCRMKVHVFGASSSPSCASYALRHLARDVQNGSKTDVQNFIEQGFYVDDGLTSLPTVAAGVELLANTRKVLSEGGLRLHKVTSNSREILSSVPQEDRSLNIRNVELFEDPLLPEKTLGIEWDIERDVFLFRLSLKGTQCTRRQILSIVSMIYGPLGLICPFVLKAKQLLQEMCRIKQPWDSELPGHLAKIWENWTSELDLLEMLNIQMFQKKQKDSE